MIQLYPTLQHTACKCPACGCELSQPDSLFFQGQHVLMDIVCTCCEEGYYQTLPVGHASIFPVAFTKDGKHTRYEPLAELWLATPLISSIASKKGVEASIEVTTFMQHNEVVLLNCLDDCWGHVFQKMLHVPYLLKQLAQSKGVILLIPAQFKWLVPEGVAEIWSVNCSLTALKSRLTNLDDFIKGRLKMYTEFSISHAPIQPNASETDISLLTRQSRFDLGQFYTLPFHIVFSLREDRFLHTTFLEETLFLASRKFGVSHFVKSYFITRQRLLVNKIMRQIKNQFPDAQFTLIGIGRSGNFGSSLTDLRTSSSKINEETERNWCFKLSTAHISIGVHGSNMLLPSALSAAFISLVPNWKLDRVGEDIVQPYQDRALHFMGRFLFGVASSKAISRHVISILHHFKHFQRLLKEGRTSL